jgi:hypothetical protein
MSRILPAICALLLTTTVPHVAGAAGREPDRNLQKLLDKAKLKYQSDEDGDFKLTIDLGNGRSQLVYVRSTAHQFGSLNLREVLSIGAAAEGSEFPPELVRKLLLANADTKLGGWSQQGRYAVYVSKIPADADARQLADAIELTATVADRLERELSGDKDEF